MLNLKLQYLKIFGELGYEQEFFETYCEFGENYLKHE